MNTVIAIFNLIIFPLNALPWTYGGILVGINSYKRVKEFFSEEELFKRED